MKRLLCVLGLHSQHQEIVIDQSAWPQERGWIDWRCVRCGRLSPKWGAR